jgi:carboxypeptidase Taq
MDIKGESEAGAMDQEQREERNKETYGMLKPCLERAMALQTALILFEWDNETLAPEEAGKYTARVQGALSEAYQEIMTGEKIKRLLEQCRKETGLSEAERAIIREAQEEYDRLVRIPPKEYRAYQELVAESARVWAKAKEQQDFAAFAPVLKEIIFYQKRFAGYRAKDGQKLYDVMLDDYEKGFSMKKLDEFFGLLKEELVPFLKKVTQSRTEIRDDFLTGDYPEEKQRELAEFLAEYVGFDFKRGVLAQSAHPFTTNLHNHDVRLTTHYKKRVDSSLFSVIHEAGHGIYELGVADELTQTLAGQGASMGMHESQSRFFENMIGRNEAFWEPIYKKLQELFPKELGKVSREEFVRAVNKVQPGLIRTEADELTYSLHVLVRYELEKMLIEENLNVEKLPELWADKYEEYLGVRPQNPAEGVLQDIHWAQGSFGYFPSYALGSAFAAQMLQFMKKSMDFEELLRKGEIEVIRHVLKRHIHRFGKMRDSRQLLRDMTGEDFEPRYYVEYLKEKYSRLYQTE